VLNVIILAGGNGTRLLGDEYPKALIRLALPPVLEVLVDNVLAFGGDTQIYVVTRSKWRQFFDPWVAGYRGRLSQRSALDGGDASSRVHILYEEIDLDATIFDGATGTLPAVYRCMRRLDTEGNLRGGDPVLILYGDNYFEGSLGKFAEQAVASLREPTCVLVNAAYRLSDYRLAKQLGVIRQQPGSDFRIAAILEKPDRPTPADSLASAGCYALKYDQKAIEDFVRSRSNEQRNIDLGYYIQDEIKKGRIAKYFPLVGAWFDTGTPRNLIQAVKHYVERHVDRVLTVRDLVDVRRESLADKCFVAVRHSKLEVSDGELKINFLSSDAVDRKKEPADVAGPALALLAKIVSTPRGKRQPEIEHFQRLTQRNPDSSTPLHAADEKLYFSGGVLLFDTREPAAASFNTNQTRIPLQRRDFGARRDPDRLTMPAGGLDTLSLADCCYAELQEEFICYVEDEAHRRRILYLAPQRTAPLSQEAFVRHIVEKGLMVPGIDPHSLRLAQVSEHARDALLLTEHVFEVDLARIAHAHPQVWKLILCLDGEEIESGYFFVSLDLATQTLECRKVAAANIAYVRGNDTYAVEPADRLFGRLAGIADGEGLGRLPLIFDANSLIPYQRQVDELSRDGFARRLLTGPDVLRVLCAGEAGTGRLNCFNVAVPVAATTKTVAEILQFVNDSGLFYTV